MEYANTAIKAEDENRKKLSREKNALLKKHVAIIEKHMAHTESLLQEKGIMDDIRKIIQLAKDSFDIYSCFDKVKQEHPHSIANIDLFKGFTDPTYIIDLVKTRFTTYLHRFLNGLEHMGEHLLNAIANTVDNGRLDETKPSPNA